MPHLDPFRGIRYHPILFSDLAEVMAPPYDLIGRREREALLRRHPRNAVRLVLGFEETGDPGTPERYATAARHLTEWLAEGILVREPRPALYGYAQRFNDPLNPAAGLLERTGFIGRIRLEPWGRGIHPHERTLAGPKADRLRLMRATLARLDPIFGLISDPRAELLEAVRATRQQSEVGSWTDDQGIDHALWAITDSGVLGEVVSGVEKRDIVIADGHHRYETALAFQEECERIGSPLARNGGAGSVLMYLTAMEDPALKILPVHRILAGVNVDELGEQIDGRLPMQPVAGGAAALAREIASGDAQIGFITRGSVARRVASPPGGEHPAALVDREILGGLLGWNAEEAVRSGRLRFATDWREAAAAIERGEADCAFLLPPTPVEEVAAAARAGRTLPQKSTYFYPKIPSGLVFDLIEAS